MGNVKSLLKRVDKKLDFLTTKQSAKVLLAFGYVQLLMMDSLTAHAAANLEKSITDNFGQVYASICTVSIVVAGVAIAANLLIGMFGGEKSIEKSKMIVKWIIVSAVGINAIGLVLNFAIGIFGRGDASSLTFSTGGSSGGSTGNQP